MLKLPSKISGNHQRIGVLNNMENIASCHKYSQRAQGQVAIQSIGRFLRYTFRITKKTEPIVKDPRTYSEETYNHFVDLFNKVSATNHEYMSFDPELKGSYHVISQPSGLFVVKDTASNLELEMRPPMQFRAESKQDSSGRAETEIMIEYPRDTARDYYPRYFKTRKYDADATDAQNPWKQDWRRNSGRDYVAAPIYDEGTVPQSLKNQEYGGSTEGAKTFSRHEPATNPKHWCWACTDPSKCSDEARITLEDGAVVSYRWYRWRDQPALQQMAREFPSVYTDSYLSQLQSRVEKMHGAGWFTPGGKSLLRRPRSTNLVEIERSLIMEPPAGKEVGWVPISLGQHYPDHIQSKRPSAFKPKHPF